MYLVVIDDSSPHIGCILVDSNPIIFCVYILLFISETSESKSQIPGYDFVLNPCLAVVVVLTLIRAFKYRMHSSPVLYFVNPNPSV